jgi:hypothetical protein
MGTRQALGITAVYMAPAVAVDGSAEGGRDTFDSSKNREIIAVLSLASLPGGTKVSYVRAARAPNVVSWKPTHEA